MSDSTRVDNALSSHSKENDSETRAMTVNMPPCLLTEILWERFAEEADEAATRDAWAEAEALWRAGSNMTESFEAADPRHAASLNGLGTAARSQDALAEAEALYRQALAAWERVPEWISGMEIELGARGITFHFRLQQRHREEFIALKRNRNEILAEGGLAATLNNLGELLRATGRGPEAEPLYRRALEARAKALGQRDEGLMRICDNLADLLEEAGGSEEALGLHARARKIEADPVPAGSRGFRNQVWTKMTDIRKLSAAVYLTPLRRRRS